VPASTLRPRVGNRVTQLVLAVSEDDRIADFAERKAALRAQVAAAGPDALLLFAADKISKVRELRLAAKLGAGTDGAALRKLAHYERSLELLGELEPDAALVQRLAAELDQLGAELPRAAHHTPAAG
jgi:hypothetical protein